MKIGDRKKIASPKRHKSAVGAWLRAVPVGGYERKRSLRLCGEKAEEQCGGVPQANMTARRANAQLADGYGVCMAAGDRARRSAPDQG
ncbi:MAG: hypothetical protein EBY17_12855 [Acidobacteriia bacterium]|nr:hypothetical protein [Terriglobia bacterium]